MSIGIKKDRSHLLLQKQMWVVCLSWHFFNDGVCRWAYYNTFRKKVYPENWSGRLRNRFWI